jgi:hypothetical protein
VTPAGTVKVDVQLVPLLFAVAVNSYLMTLNPFAEFSALTPLPLQIEVVEDSALGATATCIGTLAIKLATKVTDRFSPPNFLIEFFMIIFYLTNLFFS